MSTLESYYIGVDVGTGSARAALVSSTGEIIAESTYATTTWRDHDNHDIYEQSTQNIWSCITQASRDVLRDSKIPPSQVKGVGFDATCSLAVCSKDDGSSISVSPNSWDGVKKGTDGEGERDIILWADHRAKKEAKKINETGNMVLDYVGGTMSLEMEIPKILWLKTHMPAAVFESSMFFDLPDYLTYRATGSYARSNCSLACKCSYVQPGVKGSKGWNDAFFNEIGLEEFVSSSYSQLGGQPGSPSSPDSLILTAGQPVGSGLSATSAAELGLLPGTPVGSAVIDAYAGWIGTIAAPMSAAEETTLEEGKYRLAAIAGTSTCHIVQSPDPVFVKGVWGPYKHAVFPGYWMNEGGQSSTGQLLDFMIDTHPASERLSALAKERGMNRFDVLTDLLKTMAKERGVEFLSLLTKDMYVYPDLHGNRSPLADNDMRGMLLGMSLDKNLSDLALRYYATGEAIALQTRQIIDEMNAKGHEIKAIFMSGGLVKNEFLMSLISNICSLPIQLPYSHSASVVLGSAMLGAIAGSDHEVGLGEIKDQAEAEKRSYAMKDRLWSVMVKMSKPGTTIQPSASEKELRLLKVKYEIFKECIDLQRKWRKNVSVALE